MSNCKKYRIKKNINRCGIIYYIAQERFLWFFWRSVFTTWHHCEFSSPTVYWNEEEVTKLLRDHIRIKNERAAAYKAVKEKIKGNEFICVE